MNIDELKEKIKKEYNVQLVTDVIQKEDGRIYAKVWIGKPMLVQLFSTEDFDWYWIKLGDNNLYKIDDPEILN